MSTAMLGHAFIFRTCSFINGNSKFIFTNRINHVQCMGLKNKSKDLINSYKIPEKPKRPLNGYFRFMSEKRPQLLKENPSLSVKELLNVISEQWKALSATAKSKYEEAALQDKEKYAEQILNYNAKLTPEQEDILHKIQLDKRQEKEKRKIKKENRTTGKPKGPLTSFGQFLQENSVPGKNVSELIKDLQIKWTQLPEYEKQKYQLIYRRNREKYEIELAKWEADMIAKGKSHLVRAKTLKSSASKPKKLRKSKPL